MVLFSEMADTRLTSISAIVDTDNGKLTAESYLPKLVKLMCNNKNIDDYEIIVCDNGKENYAEKYDKSFDEKIKYVKANEGEPVATCLNKSLYQCSKNYVLILKDHTLPADNYFDETIPLLNSVNNIFGISSKVIDCDGTTVAYEANLPQTTHGIISERVNAKAEKPCYTFGLSIHNYLADRKKLAMMGGFKNLFDLKFDNDIDSCLKAWRYSWKCIYTPTTQCTITKVDKHPLMYRDESQVTNTIMLNYLHSRGWKHFRFMFLWTTAFVVSLIYPTKRFKRVRKSGYNFLKKLPDAFEIRKWEYENIHKNVDATISDMFGKDIEITMKK